MTLMLRHPKSTLKPSVVGEPSGQTQYPGASWLEVRKVCATSPRDYQKASPMKQPFQGLRLIKELSNTIIKRPGENDVKKKVRGEKQ
jgi:hypothetical protein